MADLQDPVHSVPFTGPKQDMFTCCAAVNLIEHSQMQKELVKAIVSVTGYGKTTPLTELGRITPRADEKFSKE